MKPSLFVSLFTSLFLLSTVAQAELPDVRVNEIMASTGTTLLTADGDAADWIELYNASDYPADISGWRLSDKTGSKAWTKGEILPEGTIVPANGYLIVFADDYTGWTNSEVHVALGFSNDGEAVTLSASDMTVVSSFEFPKQIKDVSYGYGRPNDVLVGTDASAEYRIGSSQTWTPATGSVGFCSVPGLFTCVQYNMGSGVNDLASALAVVANPSKCSSVVTGMCETVAFVDNDNGKFSTQKFPGNTSTSQGRDYFVLTAKGSIYIPRPGMWSFAVGSDDGFRLEIKGHGKSYSTEFTTGRSYASSIGVFNFPEAGAYELDLTYFEINGGASLELSAAEGAIYNFNTTDFHLIGSPECPILHAGAFASSIWTDIGEAMIGNADSLEWRTTFNYSGTPAEGDTLRLSIRYVDGFVATLNGTEIARDNTSNIADRSNIANIPVDFDIPTSLLQAGANTLSITGYNNALSDPNFILAPELYYVPAAESLVYFREPTPGAANTTMPYGNMTPTVEFSEPRGYKTEPFDLVLSCPDAPTSPIYYTTDGTSPSALNGTLYTDPIHITTTTVVRAAVPVSRSVLQYDATATYLFLEDILRQGTSTPAGFPNSREVNNQNMTYGMRTDLDQARLLNGFTNGICTLSIVVDPGNLFNAHTGIYVNASNDGRGWERAVHVEQIDPVNGASNEFAIPAGLRIRGAYSRTPDFAKHSLRLFFRSEYGASSLDFPLFGDEGASSFEKVDLRTSQNHSWSNENSGNDNFIHEVFSRDTQRDMGQPYTRSRYYNLFINGIYWGIYQTQERGDADYAETYFGGDADEWDCIKTSMPGYVTTAADGTFDAFYALWNIAVNLGFGPSYPNNYYRVLGLNPDGSRNPLYPTYLNPTNLMDFMIDVHFAVDSDSPAASGMPNNMYALRNRLGERGGFVWLRHDSEHSLGLDSNVNTDSLLWGTHDANSVFSQRSAFNPAELHYQLLQNEEYRRAFADRIQKHCFGEGALTSQAAVRRFATRMEELQDSITCELARWGRSHTYQEWLNRCNTITNNFLARRTPILIQHYRKYGWFPPIDAPNANRYSGELAENENLVLYSTTPFFYTTDGSDPRATNTSASPTAIRVGSVAIPTASLVSKGATWSYYDYGNQPANDSDDHPWFDPAYTAATDWASGTGIFGFAGNDGNPIATQTHRYINHGSSGTQVVTTYFRTTLNVSAESDPAAVTQLSANILYDDGYILYLNGTEIARENLPTSGVIYSTYTSSTISHPAQQTYQVSTITIPMGLLHEGENTLALELHQCNAGSTDLYFDAEIATVPPSIHASVPVGAEATTVLARSYDADTATWSALTEIIVSAPHAAEAAPAADALRIASIMSSTPDEGGDGSEYIVLTNILADASVYLKDVRITCQKVGKTPSLDLTLPAILLSPGDSFTLTKADYWPNAKITNGEVDGFLYDADGEIIQTFYIDASWWNDACDGTGAAFIATDFGPTVTTQSQWKPTFAPDLRGWLAVSEIMSCTADRGPTGVGDGREYIVLTNNASFKVDLSGIRFTFAKQATKPSNTCDVTFPAGTSIKKNGSLTLRREDYADLGWSKITNGKVMGFLYDAAGNIIQTLYIDADWWNKACNGTGASFLALEYGENVTTDTQWAPSFTPPTDKNGLKTFKEAAAIEEVRLWILDHSSNPDFQSSITAFTGSVDDIQLAYLLNLDSLDAPNVDLRIESIDFDNDTLSLTAALKVNGTEHTQDLNGSIYLLRSDSLTSTPSTNALDATHFPVSISGLEATQDSAFFRLLIQ